MSMTLNWPVLAYPNT